MIKTKDTGNTAGERTGEEATFYLPSGTGGKTVCRTETGLMETLNNQMVGKFIIPFEEKGRTFWVKGAYVLKRPEKRWFFYIK